MNEVSLEGRKGDRAAKRRANRIEAAVLEYENELVHLVAYPR